MIRSVASTMAQAAMLRIPGWTFEFDSSKTRAGMCWYGPKKITLSVHFVDNSTLEQVHDTILHEIAHALAGHAAGHGPVWKAIAVGLGCSGAVTCDQFMLGQWQAECTCGIIHSKHRKPRRQYMCLKTNRQLEYKKVV